MFLTYTDFQLPISASKKVNLLRFDEWYEDDPFECTHISQGVMKPLRWIKRKGRSYHSLVPLTLQLIETEDTVDTRTIADIGSATKSVQSRGMVKKWLRECLENHPSCRAEKRSKPFFPTRILDIGRIGDRTIKLKTLITKEMLSKPYATLSYCWGTSKFLRLQTRTLDQFFDGISVQSLPRTFKNAIALTREVGLTYLWIDSLCIMQDSKADWAAQSAVMGDIYSQSHLNIAATASESSDGGLFFERSPLSVLPMQVSAHVPFGEKKMPKKMYSIVDTSQISHFCAVGTAPLHTRAWAMQERILAPRTLHCAEDMLYWECRSCFANESYPKDLGLQYDAGTIVRETLRRSPSRAVSQDLFSSEACTWLQFIKEYTARRLSKDEDILVAVSGLAKQWQERFPDQYVAGLWRTFLAIGLLWHGETEDLMKLGGDSCETWRAPSWSWASYKGAVTWSDQIVPRQSLSVVSNITAELLSFKNVDISSAAGDETGQLRSGSITLSGFLTEIVVGSKYIYGANDMLRSYDRSTRPAALYTSNTKFEGYVHFDSHDFLHGIKCTSYFIGLPVVAVYRGNGRSELPKSTRKVPMTIGIEGILLRRKDVNPNNSNWERLGYFSVSSELDSREQMSAICDGLASCELDEIADRLGFGNAKCLTLM